MAIMASFSNSPAGNSSRPHFVREAQMSPGFFTQQEVLFCTFDAAISKLDNIYIKPRCFLWNFYCSEP
jgi:hypothetical protein